MANTNGPRRNSRPSSRRTPGRVSATGAGRAARRTEPSASMSSRRRTPMHRSSESIAALAAALAKAQSELSNPEKSLVATIGTDRPGEGARTFRYAPLSSRLDIVRKALGQQQIATGQATAIDAAPGTRELPTARAHACGERV